MPISAKWKHKSSIHIGFIAFNGGVTTFFAKSVCQILVIFLWSGLYVASRIPRKLRKFKIEASVLYWMTTNLIIKLFWKFQAGNWCIFQGGKACMFEQYRSLFNNDFFNKIDIKYDLRDSNRVEQPICSMTRYGLKHIGYQGASLWNPLPHDLKDCINLKSLQSLIQSCNDPVCPCGSCHDDVIKWRHFPRYWPFVRGIHRSPGEFPTQKPVTRSFDVYFDLRPNKRLSKQSWGWWFETPSRPSWRHRNVYFVNFSHVVTILSCVWMYFLCHWHQGLTMYVSQTAHNHPHHHLHNRFHLLHFICVYFTHFSIVLSVNSSAS